MTTEMAARLAEQRPDDLGRESRAGSSSKSGSKRSSQSRAADAEMELLRVQEELALAQQRVELERRKEEEERVQAERRRREQLAELEEEVTRRAFQLRREQVRDGSHRSGVSHRSLASLTLDPPEMRTKNWIEQGRTEVFQAATEIESVQQLNNPTSESLIPPIHARQLPNPSQQEPILSPTFRQPSHLVHGIPNIPTTSWHQSRPRPPHASYGNEILPGSFRPPSQPMLRDPIPQASVTQPHSSNEHPNCCWETYFARKSVGKSLPTFSGEPSEWFNFITEFRRSTEVCKFSNTENLVRLQRALVGKAKESVSAMLCLPDCVNEIINVLELQFGRPNSIIRDLSLKIHRFPQLQDDGTPLIIDFYTKVNNLVMTICALQYYDHLSNPQLLEDLVSKLTPALKMQWGEELVKLNLLIPDLWHFKDWLYHKSVAISLAVPTPCKSFDKKNVHVLASGEGSSHEISNQAQGTCLFCNKKSHYILKCFMFKKMDAKGRKEWVSKAGLCFSCLAKNHYAAECNRVKKCGKDGCSHLHHPLLHTNNEGVKEDKGQENKQVVGNSTDGSRVLLKILPVNVKGPLGEIKVYALLDEGSTTSLIDKSVADAIGAKGPVKPLSIRWINDINNRDEESQLVSITVSGFGRKCKSFTMENVRTIDGLSLPGQSVDLVEITENWSNVKPFGSVLDRGQPKILIGQDNWGLLESTQRVRNVFNGLSMSRTGLGWVLHGNCDPSKTRNSDRMLHICHLTTDSDLNLHKLVKSYFSLESVDFPNSIDELSREDREAIGVVQNTAVCKNKRWEVGLPWKSLDTLLPKQKDVALKRLFCIERKMDRDKNFEIQYCQKMSYYFERGYARKLTSNEAAIETAKTWYLPHLAVFNPNKPGKLRVVFDASAKVGGMSLNDALIKGPDLYNSIVGILIRFRKGKIGFGGDIQEMFLRIKIAEKDQDAQRFFWRGRDRNRDPDVCIMKSMLFGAISSPFQAQEIIRKNALRFQDEYPKAVDAIHESHYMDDYLDSSDSEQEAIKLIKDVAYIHLEGGFKMVNWVCNSQYVLNTINHELRLEGTLCSLDKDHSEKILGLKWVPHKDVCKFVINHRKICPDVFQGIRLPTKREFLRVLMSIFDPLGFLCPLTVKAKIILQDIWRLKSDWDTQINQTFSERWNIWLSEFKEIEGLEISRCYSTKLSDACHVELHTFCDASDRSYAAVTYLRLVLSNGIIEFMFVAAKNRLGPLKQLSVPRLELQAALLGAKLSDSIRKLLKLKLHKVHLWSDSKTVIYWLRHSEQRYKMFIAHRINQILELSDPSEWHWLPGTENIADEATKVVKHISGRWLVGPPFLVKEDWEWPINNEGLSDAMDCLELLNFVVDNKPNPLWFLLPDISRFSKFLRLLRSTAWALRFYKSCLRKEKNHSKHLMPEEIDFAEMIWIQKIQSEYFHSEINSIKNKEPLSKHSKLYRLTPFLDEHSVLRVKGRIERVEGVSSDLKQPIILEPKGLFVSLLIDHYHKEALHQGQERVINELRQRYWILGVRRAVRSAWYRCRECTMQRARPLQQSMSPLPKMRLARNSRPFTYTGIDYFGPLTVTVRRSREKRYCALFTCLTTRAIHLEVVTDLTANSTILAIQRFISRRGCPKEIWSDNGTNFKRAAKEVIIHLKIMDNNAIADQLSLKGVSWRFIPPGAPHVGGSWEVMVRSVKRALNSCLKEKAPKEEMLATLLTEVEFLINSRPLTRVSDDPADLEAITPNHLLLGSSNGRIWMTPENSSRDLRQNWRETQFMVESFWKRWTKEYLPTLIKSTKWFTEQPSAYVGQLVFLPENNRYGQWTRGIITATYPGKDGKIRVVEVKTQHGVLKRSINSLCPLGVEDTLASVTS